MIGLEAAKRRAHDPTRLAAYRDRALARLLRFALRKVPAYRSLDRALLRHVDREPRRVLSALPRIDRDAIEIAIRSAGFTVSTTG